MTAFEWLQLLIAGSLAGLAAGLFGVGGGVVVVPAVTALLSAQDLPMDLVSRMAVATSLATIAGNGIASAGAHAQRGAVEWRTALWMSPGLMLGAVVSAWLITLAPGQWLTLGFAIFCFLVAWRLLHKADADQPAPTMQPQASHWVGFGTLVGAISATVGIGGGSLNVPLLRAFGRSMRVAVGTAAAAGVPIAVAGSAVMMVVQVDNAPVGSFGYVWLPATVVMLVCGLCGAPLGAALAHRLPAAWLQRTFGVLLVGMGLVMAYRSFFGA